MAGSRLRHAALCVAAFAVCVGEGLCLAAALVATALWLVDEARDPEARATWRRWLTAQPWSTYAVLFGFGLWVAAGLAAALGNGLVPTAVATNEAMTAVLLGLGVLMARRTSAAELRPLFWALLAGTAVALAMGVCQLLWGSFPGESFLARGDRAWMGQLYIPGTSERALTGTLRNRVKLSEMLLFVMAALVGWGLGPRQLVSRLAAAGAWVLAYAALVHTYTLGSRDVAVLGVAALTVLTGKLWARRALGTALAALAVGLTGLVVRGLGRADLLGPVPSGKWALREWIWVHALAIAQDYPWLGAGLGTYARVARRYFAAPDDVLAFTLNAHNQHLTVLAEGGVVGLAAWLALGVGVGAGLHRAWQRQLVAPQGALRLTATGYLLTLLPLSFVHDVLFHPVAALLAWWSAGVLLALGAEGGGALQKPTGLNTKG